MRKILLIVLLLTIVVVKSQVIQTIAGDTIAGSSGDNGPAANARLHAPEWIIFDNTGNIYIADNNNNKIRKIDTSGIISTIAGTGAAGFSGDGGPAVHAKLNQPWGLALDKKGNLFVADSYNHRVRKIDTAGIITTVVSHGGGFAGDGGPATAALLNRPMGLLFDTDDNLYISDYYNNRIRRVDTTGIITTIAGCCTGGYSGDGGPATAATFSGPIGLAFDGTGHLYIADSWNQCIRRIDKMGMINTVAGNGGQGSIGDGGPATAANLYCPNSVTFDPWGDMIISDACNNRIRKVNRYGIISTIAGNGVNGFSGDGGPAINAEMNLPDAVAFDKFSRMYITDTWNNRIRIVAKDLIPTEMRSIKEAYGITIYPNPVVDKLFVNSDDKIVSITITNSLGQIILQPKPIFGKNMVDLSIIASGVYYIQIGTSTALFTEKLIIRR
jgi:sugar lactone lactonase YvrE